MAPRRVAPQHSSLHSLLSTALVLAAICIAALATRSIGRSLPTRMFDWSWDAVGAECKAFIGPAGTVMFKVFFRFHPSFLRGTGRISVSPAQEHVAGAQWWTAYQAVSYIIASNRGTREQYAQMTKMCHEAGVKVIADIILNHMTGIDVGDGSIGVAGSRARSLVRLNRLPQRLMSRIPAFSHYSYHGLYNYNDFHHCGTLNEGIYDFNNRVEAQTCQLLNLADLDTGSEYVCTQLARHANDLALLGVDGFRVDAAKHIAASELQNIVDRFVGKPYLTQEVVSSCSDTIQASEYTGIGDVQEFRYTTAIQSAFSSTGIAALQNLDNRAKLRLGGWISGSSANVFVANHDTERSGGSLRYDSPSNAYVLAHIFSLAHPYGKPTILSSFSITDFDAGGPGEGDCSNVLNQLNLDGMVGFRNEVDGARMNNWVSPGPQQIAFGRGSAGFVAINNQDSPWTATFKTALPAGQYCDVIRGRIVAAKCSDTTFTVALDGTFRTTVLSRDAIALHIGAMGGGGEGPGSAMLFTIYMSGTAATPRRYVKRDEGPGAQIPPLLVTEVHDGPPILWDFLPLLNGNPVIGNHIRMVGADGAVIGQAIRQGPHGAEKVALGAAHRGENLWVLKPQPSPNAFIIVAYDDNDIGWVESPGVTGISLVELENPPSPDCDDTEMNGVEEVNAMDVLI
ncbi:glycoside hydrolase superfamily [Infundibulicybe gibba]|nr:glycoside hydrolase superfamily [Infundibulicybe gibba]